MKNYTHSFVVPVPPEKAFEAIRDIAGWWIGDVKGKSNKVGDEFTYKYKTFHKTKQKMTELVPNKKLAWEVTESEINFVKNKEEWLGTELVFELKPTPKGTEVVFTHKGLTPKIECYGGCSDGWDFYLKKSLPAFIQTGKGIDPGF